MKRIYLFSISLLVLLLLNTLPIRADVLGPYIAEGNTPDIRVGYGRIVCYAVNITSNWKCYNS